MAEDIHGYFILDVSVLTKGLGTIKKWFENDEYNVKLFIPSYTIHELDYLKTGSSVISRNARESIRFIDKFFSSEHEGNSSELIIETPEEVGPSWKKCNKYKIRSPKIGEFEDLTQIKKSLNIEGPKTDAIQYENDLVDQISSLDIKAKNESGKRAELPPRMKYLIRPCIKKTQLDEENWVLITEDSATKIWCEAFGINCATITQAESKLFHNKNKHIKILTTRPNSKGKRSVKKDENNNNVIVERFNTISYAPRGQGELWVP